MSSLYSITNVCSLFLNIDYVILDYYLKFNSMKTIKQALLLVFLLFLSFYSYGQNSPLQIVNNSGCSMEIELHNSICNSTSCTPFTVCVDPGATINITTASPCWGNGSYQWARAIITPYNIDGCQEQCGEPQSLINPNTCGQSNKSVKISCANCPKANASFTGSNDMVIQ